MPVQRYSGPDQTRSVQPHRQRRLLVLVSAAAKLNWRLILAVSNPNCVYVQNFLRVRALNNRCRRGTITNAKTIVQSSAPYSTFLILLDMKRRTTAAVARPHSTTAAISGCLTCFSSARAIAESRFAGSWFNRIVQNVTFKPVVETRGICFRILPRRWLYVLGTPFLVPD